METFIMILDWILLAFGLFTAFNKNRTYKDSALLCLSYMFLTLMTLEGLNMLMCSVWLVTFLNQYNVYDNKEVK